MPPDARKLHATDVLRELALLFGVPAHDRHVYCVFGTYERLRAFGVRLQEEVSKGSFNRLGRVEYLSLTRDLLGRVPALRRRFQEVSPPQHKLKGQSLQTLNARW